MVARGRRGPCSRGAACDVLDIDPRDIIAGLLPALPQCRSEGDGVQAPCHQLHRSQRV
jgi:hypothetical protein